MFVYLSILMFRFFKQNCVTSINRYNIYVQSFVHALIYFIRRFREQHMYRVVHALTYLIRVFTPQYKKDILTNLLRLLFTLKPISGPKLNKRTA